MDIAAVERMVEAQYAEALKMRAKVGHPEEKAKWTGALITLEEQMAHLRPDQEWAAEIIQRLAKETA